MHDFEHLEIDPHNLHEELAKQPGMYGFWSKKRNEALKRLKKAEENVKIIRSELIRACYNDPDGTINQSKPTAQPIEAYYRTHKDYLEAKEELVEAQVEFDEYEQKLFNIHQRKASLDGLVKLYSMEYFSDITVPKNFKDKTHYQKDTEDRRNRVNEKVKNRSRNRG